MHQVDLSIIIVNWNSKDYLAKCIGSIIAKTFDINYEIIVIDNASFDGSREILQQKYPQVHFIQSETNLGFARANNEAYKVSRGRNLLFLNPDTEIDGNAITELFKCMETIPNAGIVGAKLLNSDKSIQTSCIQSFPTILNQILDNEILRSMFPRSGLWGIASLYDFLEYPSKVDAVSGACLMIKRSLFKKVGMFSTDYFMYSEDMDLCLKVHKMGWKIYFNPKSEVIHHGGGSSSKRKLNIFSDIMIIESRFRFFKKTRSVFYSQLFRIAMFSISAFRIILLLCSWPLFKLGGRSSLANKALKKWTAKLSWTLGFENWVKNY